MSPPVDLVNQVLALPHDERANLLRQVIHSINEEGSEDDQRAVNQLWSDEIDARIDEASADSSIEVDSRTAIARAREALRNDKP